MIALQDAIVEANLFLEPVEFWIVRSSHGPWLASEKNQGETIHACSVCYGIIWIGMERQ